MSTKSRFSCNDFRKLLKRLTKVVKIVRLKQRFEEAACLEVVGWEPAENTAQADACSPKEMEDGFLKQRRQEVAHRETTIGRAGKKQHT